MSPWEKVKPYCPHPVPPPPKFNVAVASTQTEASMADESARLTPEALAEDEALRLRGPHKPNEEPTKTKETTETLTNMPADESGNEIQK